ncbi:MAG: alpha/beta hydrolase, partial [Sneathiella sp.]|nr:alpha/beta hydrolase [Sneathiella sp.]
FFLTPYAETAVAHNNFAFIDRLWKDRSPDWKLDPDYMRKLKETLSKSGTLKNALTYYRQKYGANQPSQRHSQFAAGFGKKTIDVPTLYLHGENDGCIGVDLQIGMTELFPKGLRSICIEGAGHFLHLEKPDLINQHVTDFLKA